MDRKLVILISIFFLSFAVFIFTVILQDPIDKLVRAERRNTPSAQNTLMFAWPLVQKADGRTPVKVDVFVRSEANTPIANQTVNLETSRGSVQPQATTSDQSGKATFTLTSDKPGIAELAAVVDNSVTASRKLTVKFQ